MKIVTTPGVTLTCDVCNREFTGPDESNARFRLSMHKSRTHGIRPVNAKPSTKKRKYKKRNSATQPPAKQQRRSSPPVSYCPCCGFNIGILGYAMEVAQRITGTRHATTERTS